MLARETEAPMLKTCLKLGRDKVVPLFLALHTRIDIVECKSPLPYVSEVRYIPTPQPYRRGTTAELDTFNGASR